MAAPNPLNPDTRLSFHISGTSHENPALILHYKIQASDNLDQAKFVSNRNTVNAAGTTSYDAWQNPGMRGPDALILHNSV